MVFASHGFSAAPSFSGTSTAPVWGRTHGRQPFMNFSRQSSSHGLQLFTNCSSIGSVLQEKAAPALLLQNKSYQKTCSTSASSPDGSCGAAPREVGINNFFHSGVASSRFIPELPGTVLSMRELLAFSPRSHPSEPLCIKALPQTPHTPLGNGTWVTQGV